MELKTFATAQQISEEISGLLLKCLARKKNALLCLAAGHTSLPVFADMIRLQKEGGADFSQCVFLGMDEWGGLDAAMTAV